MVTLHDPEALATRYRTTDSTISGGQEDKCSCNRCGCTLFSRFDGREGTVVRTVLIEDG